MEDILKEHQETPCCILDVAYQPTACGGQIHYMAGNIRFVAMARNLLEEAQRSNRLTTMDAGLVMTIGVQWEEKDMVWRTYLEVEHGIHLA